MNSFIKVQNSYNPLTTQGEGEKYINVQHIISITKWQNQTNKRISTIKTRIKLSDGELLDVKESSEELIKQINQTI